MAVSLLNIQPCAWGVGGVMAEGGGAGLTRTTAVTSQSPG